MTEVPVTMAFFVKLETESQFNPTKELQELEDPAFKQTPFNCVKKFQWNKHIRVMFEKPGAPSSWL